MLKLNPYRLNQLLRLKQELFQTAAQGERGRKELTNEELVWLFRSLLNDARMLNTEKRESVTVAKTNK